ncbi:Putative glucosylceramidase 1 [Caenorhabditis elegans]|uniref:Putative glucosylceramidase 1 n=2 Tax=Caenorhabditis elegans TaxID=6239 RepID=GLCM1_CAEEL|nr:Putative glucosylceramidase 1 [Caenorhabditis elegans]O16580.2 RecName: Full=Putative glucosylceramidase 1; Flags: Precursor [Caenorhabditis elegans]CCD66449.1 Putative glucosylceramidase 1 [Caenorhabditis elegans]|eukprot:NP_001040750.1 Putative glucosylceramidase 1 [Caenorhabditis elegans]
MKSRFLLKIFIFLAVFGVDSVRAADCTEKTFKTGTVCVCSLDSCDEIPPLDITMGQAALYTTSHTGARLHRDVIYATDTEPFGTLHMTIDSSKKYQTIQGFGSTFSDASGANLKSLPDKLSDLIMKQYFSDTGLNLQFGRVPIASTDFSGRVYSYNDVANDYSMQNFNLTKEDFQWKIPYIKNAQKYNPNLKLFAAPWAAPGWLKTTKEMTGPGALNGKAGDNYHQAYAKYFVRFLEEYGKSGISFWGLSTQNQPTLGSDKKNKIQSTLFTAETQRDFIKTDLGPALAASSSGKDVKLLILDDNRGNLPKWADTVLNDMDAAKYVGGIGVHAYQDGETDNHLDETHKKHPNFFILGTEASEGYGSKDTHVDYGNWDRAADTASDILDNMNNWMTGWTERNLILDALGGPSWVSDYTDAPVIAFPAMAQFYKQPMFYAIAHFSHFIKPGAVRIDHSLNVIELEVETTAFLNPDGSKVIVMLNKGSLVSTEHTVVVQDAADSRNHYHFTLPHRAITTLYIQTSQF